MADDDAFDNAESAVDLVSLALRSVTTWAGTARISGSWELKRVRDP